MPISEPWVRTNGQLQVNTTFNKSLGKTAISAWKCLKTQFWGPLTNWKFEPSPRAHTHSDLIVNKHTEHVKKLCMDLSWHTLNSTLQAKTITLKSKDLATCGFQKKDTPTKTRWSQTQFQKGQPTPCKTKYAFPHSPLVRVLATNLLPLKGPGLRPIVQNSS